MHTPSRISCLTATATRVSGWDELRVCTSEYSLITEETLKTRTPLAIGMNLRITGIESPAALALKGSVIEYMILPGHVFSISSVWLNSRASGVNVRFSVKGRVACRLNPKPERMTVARSLYWIMPSPVAVVMLDGSLPSSVYVKGKLCWPALSVCARLLPSRNDQSCDRMLWV